MTSSKTPALILLSLLLLGSLAYTLHPVQAQSRSRAMEGRPDDPLAFQLSEVGPRTGLTVYNAADHNLYVYENVTGGNAHINCAYSLHIEKPGGPVERRNCSVGAAY